MEKTNNKYGCKVPSLKEVTLFLANCDSPLGDLCNDMLSSTGNINFDDPKETTWYLKEVIAKKGEYIRRPVKAFLQIYKLINEE